MNVSERPVSFLAVTGPTASGKTDLSLALAEHLEIEIISTIAKLQETGKITNRCVEPDIKIFVIGIRNFESEVGSVARNVPILQSNIEPFLKFSHYILMYSDLKKNIELVAPSVRANPIVHSRS